MYLSDKQVAERYGVARGTPWRWVKTDPQFPSPVELTPGCTRWRLEDLENWEQTKAARGVKDGGVLRARGGGPAA